MTDNQFNLLIAVIGAGLTSIGLAIRFSVGRLIKALDANSTAMLENTKANAVLSTKIDAIADYVQHRRERELTPIEGIPVRPAGGYSQFPRRKSEPGEDR